MNWTGYLRRTLPVVAVLALAACSARPGSSFGEASESIAPPSMSVNPLASAPAAPTVAAPTELASGSVAPSVASDSPSEAARRIVEANAAGVELTIQREKRQTDPVETLLTGSGRIEPSIGRGEMRYDLTGLFAIPGASPSSDPTVFDIVWTDEDLWARSGAAADWQERTRDEARQNGGLLGRLPDELTGLVNLIAESDPDQAEPAGPDQLNGQAAERWTVTTSIENLAGHRVPADAPHASVLREAYGIDDLAVDVWVVEGLLRRARYAFAREKAPYGGPDRTTTTYDWLPATNEAPIELPG